MSCRVGSTGPFERTPGQSALSVAILLCEPCQRTGSGIPCPSRIGCCDTRAGRRHAPPNHLRHFHDDDHRPGSGRTKSCSRPPGDHFAPLPPHLSMKVLVVAGARPNFMKVAPILRALLAAGHEGVLMHTGQHYDASMSDAFFTDLELPEPTYHLGVGSGSHAQQTARVMEKFEPVLHEARPDWVVVVGDVNSTLACALVASKLREELGTRVAHVEAGLRSRDWRMPEEINRVITDRLSDLLLTPSRDAEPNLLAEGLAAERIRFVGNVMIDTLLHQLPRARELDLPGGLGLERGHYVASTLHRPSNVDDVDAFSAVLTALAEVAQELPVVLPIHPRTRKNAEAFGLGHLLERLTVLEPLGYREMLSLTEGAAVVLTDSGGLQEETTALGVPCVTLREQTERPVTVTEGTNRLAPWPLTTEGVLGSFRAALDQGRADPGKHRPEGWDGRAGERVVEALGNFEL
jgi:UDP-N-acetylglucosamine 2-epimerase (non-hydrolysing)